MIAPERVTIAAMLKERGYSTACMGKWHVGMDWQLKEEYGEDQFLQELSSKESDFDSMVDFSKPIKNGPVDVGFDYFFGISASLDMSPYVFIENDRATEIPCEMVPKGNTEEERARQGIGARGWRHEDVLPALKEKSC